MSKQITICEFSDEELNLAAQRLRKSLLSVMPSPKECEREFSQEFCCKMQDLIDQQRRLSKARQILRDIKRVAVVVLAVAVLSFGGLMTVEAYRARVIEVVVQVFHDFTEYRFSSEKNNMTNIVLPELSLEFVPDEMREVRNKITTNRRRIIFENDEGSFFELTQRFIASDGIHETVLDTEDSIYTVITIGDNEAYLNVKDEEISIIWTENELVYHLYGNLGINEMIKIAENIRPVSMIGK